MLNYALQAHTTPFPLSFSRESDRSKPKPEPPIIQTNFYDSKAYIILVE